MLKNAKYDKFFGLKSVEFEFEEKRAIVVFPEIPDEKRNWCLKTEYWGAFPDRELDLARRGFHLCYLENETRWATRSDCDRKARFVSFLHDELGLRDKCVPVGMSCGGDHAFNFAGFYPECVACIYVDAPVLNFCSCPGKLGDKSSEEIWENEFVKAYPGITRAKLLGFDNHPIGKADIIKKHGIPIAMSYGTEDQSVNYNENGRLLEIEYEGDEHLLVMPRPCQGHHPHGAVPEVGKLIDFIVKACE